jgi:ribosome-associated protein
VSTRVPTVLEILPRLRIPGGEIHLSYAASSGPGGQNVNKVASKAVLRFSVRDTPSLRPDDRALLLERLASRLTTEGELVLACDRHRDQGQNVEEVLERLKDVLRAGLHRERPRKKTRPTRGSRERRIAGKRRRSDVKRGRRDAGE